MTDPKTFPKTQNWLIFLMVAIGIFMATLDGSIVNIALPSIMADFAVPLATIQWVSMIYLLTVTSLLLSFGRLSDIQGRRIVYSLGLCLFSLGSFFSILLQKCINSAGLKSLSVSKNSFPASALSPFLLSPSSYQAGFEA